MIIDIQKPSTYDRLQNRNIQFQKCSDCLDKTLQKHPIATLNMNSEQALCSSCLNTSLHLVPKIKEQQQDDITSYIVYRKIYCKLHQKKHEQKCKECSIYLEEKNYSKCPFCEFSIFRRNMKKWSLLYPIHQCEICNHVTCLKCKQVPELIGNQNIECFTCEERKNKFSYHFYNTLKHLNTFKGIQFILIIFCVALFTPIQIMGKVTNFTSEIIGWRPYNEVNQRQYIFKLVYLIVVGPLLWLWIYIRYFCQLFSESYTENVKILYHQMIPQQ